MSRRGPNRNRVLEWGIWLIRTDQPTVRFIREVVSTILVVAIIGALLYSASGVWPPMVAVESGSMEPHMFRGDLVFVVGPTRFVGPDQEVRDGIITAAEGATRGYEKFGAPGDVIVYRPNGGQETPVIHRAHFWVNASENWVNKADHDALPGSSCGTTRNCPAPHAGFITKGDANDFYDQATGISEPVQEEWVTGRAIIRIPWIGYVRLILDEYSTP